MKKGFWAWYADRIRGFPKWFMNELRGLGLDPIDECAIGIMGFFIGLCGGFYLLVTGEFLKGGSFLVSVPFWVTVCCHGKWRGLS